MKIVMDDTKTPVMVEMRKSPTEHREFLDVYFSKLVEMGFLKPFLQAFWQAAPDLVPKCSKSKYRTTTDLRTVDAGTFAEQWPMPLIEAELNDFIVIPHLTFLDFCSGYLQCSSDPTSSDPCEIIARQGTFVPTRVVLARKTTSAYFQSTILPLFKSKIHAVKPWLNDLTIQTNT